MRFFFIDYLYFCVFEDEFLQIDCKLLTVLIFFIEILQGASCLKAFVAMKPVFFYASFPGFSEVYVVRHTNFDKYFVFQEKDA
jgi:hypothetical protein